MNPDQLAELEEERRFLLRSLGDLDREHDVGDVDDADYHTLRDGYIARAAVVLRSIDEGRAMLPAKRDRSWGRIAAGVVVTLGIAGGLGWWVAHSSGQRLAGQSITGDAPIDKAAALLTEARQLTGVDNVAAYQKYQEVVKEEPDNVEALAYGAFLQINISGQAAPADAQVLYEQAIESFERAISIDPTYPDAHCLLAVVYGRFEPINQPGAFSEATACLKFDPPADMRDAVQGLIVENTPTT